MNRTRELAIGAFTGVIVLLLGVIVFVEFANSSQTVLVWHLKKDVSAGTPFTADVVEQVQIKGQPGDFAYTSKNPANTVVFRSSMHKLDVVRDDDLVSSSDVAEIPIKTAENVDFSSSNAIDIYLLIPDSASASGECVQQIGSHVPVAGNLSGSLTIQVPRDKEAAWLAITNTTGTSLVVASSGGAPVDTSQPGVGTPLCSHEAINTLIKALGGS